MGFWDSYNKEMVRQGYSEHSRFGAFDDTEERKSERPRAVSRFKEEDASGPETDDDPHMAAAEQALARYDFETALEEYFAALEGGNIQALLKLADVIALITLYDRNDRPYEIGSNPNRDYSLEYAVTFYMTCLIFPECESEAKNRLGILHERCFPEYEFQMMLQRVGKRISDSIAQDPVGFVRSILTQYKHKRS